MSRPSVLRSGFGSEEVITVRRREPPPCCAQCGLETDYLFDGFTVPTKARGKFIEGERIRLSSAGKLASANRTRKAILFSFCKDEETIRILWDGNQQPEYYHMDFFVPDKRKRKIPFEPQPAKVCHEHRPASNLEIKEMLEAWRT